ncbi:hypothetical protein [Motilimonas eburnea]|uniref:hypothetical protein n=1 Tax=Motilimonas eburnea TaxID=1737488 RepID=UPI001E65714E|nr:hypothetical protein [Motilimonas eburnea]MCE2571850.1 hypothetical protein [Motilimonas eburnea]
MYNVDKAACMIAAVFITVLVLAFGLPKIGSDDYTELAQTAELCPTTFFETNFEKVNRFEHLIYLYWCDDEEQERQLDAALQKIAEVKAELAIAQQASKR